MAKDFVVNITGKDNLSATLNQVKQELKDTGGSVSALDQIQQKFERLEASTIPLNKQIKIMRNIMAKMNVDGLDSSSIYHTMAARAAEYKDALGDATEDIKKLSSDTAGLDAGIEAAQGFAGALSIATGVMGMFGSENKNVEKAILKVQSAISLLNGVQAVANVLNKDSILRLKLKQYWQIAVAAAQDKETASNNANTASNNVNTASKTANANASKIATGTEIADTVSKNANTVSNGINTTSITINTIATKAWNVAKAIGKALLGDLTGLLLVGAAALASYAATTLIASKAEDESAEAKKKQISLSEQLANTLSQKLGTETTNLVGKYLSLRSAWNNCRNAQEKNAFIKNNANQFKNLGLKVTDVRSAENAFVNNTGNVIAALNARAKAAAYAAVQQQLYEEALREQLNINRQKDIYTYKGRRQTEHRIKEETGVTVHDKGRYTTNKLNKEQQDVNRKFEEANKLGAQVAKQWRIAASYSNKSGAFGSSSSGGSGSSKGGSSKGGSSKGDTNNDNDKTYKEDATTLEDMSNNVSILEDKLKTLKPNSEEFEKTADILNIWKDRVEAVQQYLKNLTFDDQADTTEKINNNISILQDNLKNLKVNSSEFKEISDELTKWQEKLDAIQYNEAANTINDINQNISILDNRLKNTQADSLDFDDLTTKLENWKKKLEKIQKVKPQIGSIEDLQSQINELQQDLNKEPLSIDVRIKKVQQIKDLQDQINFKSDPEKYVQDKKKDEEDRKKEIKDKQKAQVDSFSSSMKDIGSSLSSVGLDGASALFNTISSITDNVYKLLDAINQVSQAANTIAEASSNTAAITSSQALAAAKNQEAAAYTAAATAVTNYATAVGISATASAGAAVGTAASTAAITSNTSATTANTAATTANTTASLSSVGVNLAATGAEGAKQAAKKPFPENLIAIATVVAAVIGIAASIYSLVGSFAQGGVIQGASTHGDQLLARVNAGEMILNGSQQAKLFNTLDGGGAIGNNTGGGQVEFKISGSTLKGVLRNYDNKTSVL